MTTGAFDSRRTPTQTSSFGVGRRENHDSSAFYARFRSSSSSTRTSVSVAAHAERWPDLGRCQVYERIAEQLGGVDGHLPALFRG